MAVKPVPHIGLRHILGLEPFPPVPQHFVKRPSHRRSSRLLPKGPCTITPFESFLYGGQSKVLTYKKDDKAQQPMKGEPEKKDDGKPAGGATGKDGEAQDKKEDKGDGKAEDKKDQKNGQTAPDGGKAGDASKDGKPPAASGDGDGFTQEQDAELMKLKNENTSWAAISTSMGKPIQALKTRFGQIKPKDWRPPPQGKAAAGNEAEKKANDTSKEKKNGEANAGWGGNKAAEGPPAAVKGDDMTSIYEFEGKQYKRMAGDERFPVEILQYAGEFDDRWYWLNMASRVFDKFGKRYTPEELKAKMGG